MSTIALECILLTYSQINATFIEQLQLKPKSSYNGIAFVHHALEKEFSIMTNIGH